MKKQIIYPFLCFFLISNILAQQIPAPKQTRIFSIEGATAHLGNGKVIENSLLIFTDGKITFVGSSLQKIARQGTIINAKGKHVYPGFIAANSSLGLVEIDAVRATNDEQETGAMLPHIRSIIAYNAESRIVETMRPNGVLMAQITPRGGVISGASSIVQLDAWNWEDATIKTNDAIHLNWPETLTNGKNYTLEEDKNYTENINKIIAFFANAKRYLKSNSPTISLPYEATKGLFNGTQKIFIHANGEREITDAIESCKNLGIDSIVIVHGKGSENIADLLLKNNVSVIIDRAHRVPDEEDDDYDLPYRTAKILTDKGITVGIGMEGEMERMNARNLPFYAGTCVTYGMNKEEALQLITSNTAKILGIDDFVGTLEVGKDATLFISEGDALDMRKNNISDAFIQGRKLSLETHQTKLWKRYTNKYQSK